MTWPAPRPAHTAPVDWLVALDDILSQRVLFCTGCGQRGGPDLWIGVWTLHDQQRSLAYPLCAACHRQPDWQARVGVKLAERYRPDRFP
jgi:hypothetical protein